jgi:DNA-directed RNA polymerase specialized sigma24 family protein
VTERGFDALYREHHPRAIRLAWLLTHDAELSEDLAQEAFLRLHRHVDRVLDPAAYLRRTVVNLVRDHARARGRERARLTIVGPPPNVAPPADPLVDLISLLPIAQRTAVVLRYWADLSDEAIAEALDVRPATVRSLLSRGVAALRRQLAEEAP